MSLRIKWTRNEPNTIPLTDLRPGSIFKVQFGKTPYMVMEQTRWSAHGSGYHSPPPLPKDPGYTPCMSLDSGQVHYFEDKSQVVELDGDLELSRIHIERRK